MILLTLEPIFYEGIVESIKKLETSNLSLVDSLKILEQVEISINELSTSANSTIVKTKCKTF